MKTTMSLALAAAASLGFAQTPTFTQVARYNLGSVGATHAPTAVAFDGTNAYVASSSTASGAVGTAIYKVANALTPSSQAATLFASQTGAAGESRAASLAFGNGSLYWGFGLGDGTATAGQTRWGVARYNLDGTLNTGFGTNGVVNQASTFIANNNLAANTRIDSIDLDPANGRLGAVAFNSGAVFEIDAQTGANIPNSALTFGASGAGSTSWRDMSFDGAGNLYARTKGGVTVRRWTRSGATFTGGADLAAIGTGAGSSGFRIEAVSGTGFDTFLLANNYAGAGAPGVSVLNATTGASITTLTGTENGLGGAFGNSAGAGSFFGLGSAVVGGTSYLLVTGRSDAGAVNTLAIYRVNPVPEPASMVALGLGAAALLRRRRR